jgi:hypothetical protein
MLRIVSISVFTSLFCAAASLRADDAKPVAFDDHILPRRSSVTVALQFEKGIGLEPLTIAIGRIRGFLLTWATPREPSRLDRGFQR